MKETKEKRLRMRSVSQRIILGLFLFVLLEAITVGIMVRGLNQLNSQIENISSSQINDLLHVTSILENLEASQKYYYQYAMLSGQQAQQKEVMNGFDEASDTIASEFTEFMKGVPDSAVSQVKGFVQVVDETLSWMKSNMQQSQSNPEIYSTTNVELQEKIDTIYTNATGMRQQCSANIQDSKATSLTVYRNILRIVNVIAVAFLLITAFCLFVLIAFVTKPLKNITSNLNTMVQDLKNGQANLDVRLEVKSKDEIGVVAQGINEYIDVLQHVIVGIKDNANQLEEQVNLASDNIHNSSDKITDTSATMEELAAGMEEVAASMNQITTNISHIKDDINRMTDDASQHDENSKKIESRAAEFKDQIAGSLGTTSDMVKEISGSLRDAIDNSKKVERINELTNEILGISEQTNLLSLNASIEAARAGEAGRGFMVVAEQIRTLAESSKSSANNIQEISGLVTDAIKQLNQNANDMLTFVNVNIMEDYNNVLSVSENYRSDAVIWMDLMNDYKDRFSGLLGEIEQIANSTAEISETLNQSSEGIANAAMYTSDVSEDLTEITGRIDGNLQIARDLKSEVERFKQA